MPDQNRPGGAPNLDAPHGSPEKARIRVDVSGGTACTGNPYRQLNLEASPAKNMRDQLRDAMLGGTPIAHPFVTESDYLVTVESSEADPHKTVYTANHMSNVMMLWQVVPCHVKTRVNP